MVKTNPTQSISTREAKKRKSEDGVVKENLLTSDTTAIVQQTPSSSSGIGIGQ